MNTPNSIPVIAASHPPRRAAEALQDLRHEGILFVGFSDVFGDALMTEEVTPFHGHQGTAEGVPA